MNIIYIQLGSNIGNRIYYINKSIDRIQKKIGNIFCESKIYESSPWKVKKQNHFLNKIIGVETLLSADQSLILLQTIENNLGRKRIKKWGERTIDLDILFYNDYVINKKELIIPHPYIQERNFILKPFAEMNGQFTHPRLKKNIFALLEECKDTEEVRVYEI